jgi:phospholipid/cholesterol/gamma-HCH transport system substrate-binding protein
MKPFRERNPVTVGAVSIVILLVLMLGAFNANRLPFIGGGTSYPAAFSDLSGLKKGDDVRVAGVRVGKVTGFSLKHGYVQVTFQAKGVHLGNQTTAAIKIKTLLGTKYLSLSPQGTGKLSTHSGIPLSRTTTAFDVPAAFSQFAKLICTTPTCNNTTQVDTAKLAQSFNTIADTFNNSPTEIRSALTGLSRLSQTIASRDAQLQQLLSSADNVTGVLASRDGQVKSLIDDGDLLLKVVEQRRAQIHALLLDTAKLAKQLTGLVRDNRAQLDPALAHLRTVVDILQRNQDNLDQGIQALAPFVRDFANTLGNGQWFDTVVYNLPPQNVQIKPCFISPKQDHKPCTQ